MPSEKANRIARARREVVREQRSVSRIELKFAGLRPGDKEYARVRRDLVQQRTQLDTALMALSNALRGDV